MKRFILRGRAVETDEIDGRLVKDGYSGKRGG